MTAEKKTFEQFIETVAEAPSSAVRGEEPAADAETPKADAPSAGTEARGTSGASSEAPPAADAIRKALAAGDLDTVADLLGEDPALYSEKSSRWAAARRKEAKIQAERDEVAGKAERIVKRWSPVAEHVAAITERGEYARVPELIQLLLGEDADAAWLKAVKSRRVEDPQVPVLRKRVAELEPLAVERATAETTAAEEAFHEILRDEVDAKHTVRQVDDWEAKVAAVLKDSIDPDLGEPRLSAKQAADRVLRREREEFERRAKVFGAAEPAPKGRARAPERASGAAPAGARKISRDEWLAKYGS